MPPRKVPPDISQALSGSALLSPNLTWQSWLLKGGNHPGMSSKGPSWSSLLTTDIMAKLCISWLWTGNLQQSEDSIWNLSDHSSLESLPARTKRLRSEDDTLKPTELKHSQSALCCCWSSKMAENRKPDPIRVCGKMRLPSGSERFSRLLTEMGVTSQHHSGPPCFWRSGEAYPPQNPGGKFPIKLSSSPFSSLAPGCWTFYSARSGLLTSSSSPLWVPDDTDVSGIRLDEGRREPCTSLPTHCVLHVQPAAHSPRSPSSKWPKTEGLWRDRLEVWSPIVVQNTSTGKMLWTRTQQRWIFFSPSQTLKQLQRKKVRGPFKVIPNKQI